MIGRKLIALLLFIGGLAAIFFMVVFFFISFEGSLIVTSNTQNYNVKISSVKTVFSKQKVCENKICKIEKIPVGEVTVNITKSGYNDNQKNVIISKDKIEKVSIKLSKLSTLKLEEKPENKDENENTEIKISNKIKLIKLKYKEDLNNLTSKIENDDNIIGLKVEDKKIEIYDYSVKNKKLLAEFNAENIDLNNIESSEIIFDKIEGKEDNYYFKINSSVYIVGEKLLKNFNFEPKINYIKFEEEFGNFIIISDTGIFILNNENNKLEYNTKFDDFVMKNGNFIGYINSSSSEKLKDFNLYFGNLIVFYNPISLEKKVILKPKFEIKKLIKQDSEIYAFDVQNNKYKLEINN
ncbi:MAG: hypothetical protein N4A38_01185 [Candidatus Gracilibacteria bacterium]|nr:hypothetical protein [Candidatus Gracilibacteria bacterium]